MGPTTQDPCRAVPRAPLGLGRTPGESKHSNGPTGRNRRPSVATRVPLRGHRRRDSARTPSGVISSSRGSGRALISGRDRREEAPRDHRSSDMERPVNPFGYLRVTSKSRHDVSGDRAAVATVDHSDIRGSTPHGRHPSGATSDEARGSGSQAGRIEGHEGSPVRVPLDRHRHGVPRSSAG